MIAGIIRQDQKKIQLIGATVGTLIGFVLLLGTAQFWFEMNSVIQTNNDLLDPEFLVLNKKITLLKTLNVGKSTFTDEEIGNIEKQPWADEVEGFVSNHFELSAYTNSTMFPDFFTELFFEAVPDEFIDIKDKKWRWEKGQDYVPIILPQDYINLYNFGFAPSQGLPQVSPATISMLTFTVRIRGNGLEKKYRGKIIGFSSRINSVLVPWGFLEEANATYGQSAENNTSRVMVVCKDPTNPEIVKFLDDNGYETIREKLKSSRLNIILKFVISFLVALGGFIIILAFMVFVLSFQLVITKSSDNIRKLKLIGYHYREISQPFIINFALLVAAVAALSAICLYLLKSNLNHYLVDLALTPTPGLHPLVLAGGLLLLVLMVVVNSWLIVRQTKAIR